MLAERSQRPGKCAEGEVSSRSANTKICTKKNAPLKLKIERRRGLEPDKKKSVETIVECKAKP